MSPLADDATRSSPSFRLVEFNPRRHIRGAEAARVNVDYGRGDADLLWMSAADIRRNMKLHGKHPELIKAMECYRRPFQHYPPVEKPMLTDLDAGVPAHG
ncbi:hypothetical protein NMB32_14430 [Stenotrophomonas sp. CD2]|nr:hypothetical protein NMB32_14430 [Stenotrophomonas sp. CD2]